MAIQNAPVGPSTAALGPGDGDPRSPSAARGDEVRPALGPGDADPRSPSAASGDEVGRALGPGDEDPRSPARGATATTAGPLAPGASVEGEDENDLVMLAPPAPGPGDAASGPRHVTHVPRRLPTLVGEAKTHDDEKPADAAVTEQPPAPQPDGKDQE